MSSTYSVSDDETSASSHTDVSSEYVSSYDAGVSSGSCDEASSGCDSSASGDSGDSGVAPPAPDGEVHRSPLLGPDEALMTRVEEYPEVTTTHDAFMASVAADPEAPFLGTREVVGEDEEGNALYGEYVWKSYGEVETLARGFGSGLVKMGMGKSGVLGIYLNQCETWTLAALAAHGMGYAVGGMYDTLGLEALEYCMNLASIRVVVASPENIPKLLAVADDVPSLKYIVYPTDSLGKKEKSKLSRKAKAKDIALVSVRQTIENGTKKKTAPWAGKKKLNKNTLNTLCFTSGTTGNPKAVMLTHGNMIADLAGGMKAGLKLERFKEVHISFMPRSHVFEKLLQLGVMMMGGSIGFFTGPATLLEDIQKLRPTLFAAVPRVLNKIHAKVTAGIEETGGLKAKLFRSAYATKKKNMERGGCCLCCRGAKKPNNKHAVYDRLVFKKTKAALGGRVKIIVTGSAPIAPDVMEFLRICFATTLEGFGQSESAAAATLTDPNDYSLGHVGFPIPCNEIALRSVPDMGYYASSSALPRKVRKSGEYKVGGEICIRGTNVMSGYYGNPKKTAETIDADGWLHTGDIGVWLEGGQLKIVDRVKALFKLSQGEYVSPGKVEDVASLSPFVAQAFVYGSSLKNYVLAVIVVDPDHIPARAAKKSKSKKKKADHDAALNSLEFRQEVLASIDSVARAQGPDGRPRLSGFEIPKNVLLRSKEFAEDDLLTPTMKMKRNVAKEFFADDFERLYAEGPIIGGAASKGAASKGNGKAKGKGKGKEKSESSSAEYGTSE